MDDLKDWDNTTLPPPLGSPPRVPFANELAMEFDEPPNAHARFALHLNLVHRILRRNCDCITVFSRSSVPIDVAALADFTHVYLRFLRLHHDGEDQILFPGLRNHGRLRSSDAAFLESRGAEHRTVHETMGALSAAASELRRKGDVALGAFAQIADELRSTLAEHLDLEESGLNEANLTAMIDAAALDDLERAIVAHEKREGDRQVIMLMLHSLLDYERNALFGPLPWFVRKALINGLWRPGYRRFTWLSFRPEVRL